MKNTLGEGGGGVLTEEIIIHAWQGRATYWMFPREIQIGSQTWNAAGLWWCLPAVAFFSNVLLGAI